MVEQMGVGRVEAVVVVETVAIRGGGEGNGLWVTGAEEKAVDLVEGVEAGEAMVAKAVMAAKKEEVAWVERGAVGIWAAVLVGCLGATGEVARAVIVAEVGLGAVASVVGLMAVLKVGRKAVAAMARVALGAVTEMVEEAIVVAESVVSEDMAREVKLVEPTGAGD